MDVEKEESDKVKMNGERGEAARERRRQGGKTDEEEGTTLYH